MTRHVIYGLFGVQMYERRNVVVDEFLCARIRVDIESGLEGNG